MHMNPRDRRKWFGVCFGRSYFKTAPHAPSIAFGLGIPMLAVLILATFVLFGHAGEGGMLFAAGPMLSIKELREKGARAASAAETFYRENAATWTPEKQTQFDVMVKDATDAQKEIQSMEARETQAAQVGELHRYFNEPVNRVAAPPVGSGGVSSVREAFNRVVRLARFSKDEKRVIVPGVSNALVDDCLAIHREAFRAYLSGDKNSLRDYAERQKHVAPAEIHALVSNEQTLGGALVPEDVRNEIITADSGAAVLANLVRTENTNRDMLVWPKITPHSSDSRRTSGFEGTWRRRGSIASTDLQDKPAFSRERIPVHDWTPDAVEVEQSLLDDASANVESIIAQAIGEALAFDKDDAILDGSGHAEPEGVLHAGISTIASGGATSIAYGGIIGLYVGVPQQYRRNSTWVMHSWTMGAIIQLNTGTGGVYLFPPGQWKGEILNRPVVFLDSDDMDKPTAEGGTTFTAGEYPVIFGDWKRYILAQRQALRIQRLAELFYPNIGIAPSSRIGGQVVLTDAFRIMTVSA